jgi:hypothetical protein
LSGENSIKATVNFALNEFVKSRKRKDFLVMEGKFEFDSDYDYKKERRKW